MKEIVLLGLMIAFPVFGITVLLILSVLTILGFLQYCIEGNRL